MCIRDRNIGDRVQALFGLDPVEEARDVHKYDNKVVEVTNPVEGGGAAVFLRFARLHRVNDPAVLQEVISRLIEPDVEMDCREIFYLHRQKDGKDLYFFTNISWQKQATMLKINLPGVPHRWNPENGEIEPLYHWRPVDGGVEIPLVMDRLESALIVLEPETPETVAVTKANVVVERVEEGKAQAFGRCKGRASATLLVNGEEKRRFNKGGKVLPEISLDKWQLTPEGDNGLVLENIEMKVEGEEAAGWIPVRPGIWEPQFPYERKSDTYPVLLRFRSEFACRYLPDDLRLLLDGLRGEYEIRLNGKKVEGKKERSELDCDIPQLDVSKYLKQGKNELEIRIKAKSATGGLLDPCLLYTSPSPRDRTRSRMPSSA